MISASAVTTRHELIMSLVAGLNLIMQGVEPNAQPPVRNRIIFKIRANDDGAVFFLFWAVRQDFIRILRTKCPFLLICP